MQTKQTVEINTIVEALTELANDITVPKNIKEKLQIAINALNDKVELSVKKDKAVQQLDEIADDTNLQPYTRTQIWNIVSMLEKL